MISTAACGSLYMCKVSSNSSLTAFTCQMHSIHRGQGQNPQTKTSSFSLIYQKAFINEEACIFVVVNPTLTTVNYAPS